MWKTYALCAAIILCDLFSVSVGSLSLRSYFRRTPLLKQCEIPAVKNGYVRLKQRGKLIQFHCLPKFTLFGVKYSMCLDGKWEDPIPFCIKSGCPPLATPEKSFISFQNNDASALLFCQPGYVIAGSQLTLCDGKDWDRDIGYCRLTNTGPETWCDFEVHTLCGWTPDSAHDIEWKRREVVTSKTQRLKPGPTHDHTKQSLTEGHYMIAESTDQLLNVAARLISPLYPASMSMDSCFRFYYYMYGLLVGRLTIYIKPKSIPVDRMLRDPKFKLFEKRGSADNLWIEGLAEIEPCDEEFQIVIEATTSGMAHMNDISIDDVALLTDGECLTDKLQTTLPPTEETGGVYDMQSCANRCQDLSTNQPDEVISSGKGRGGIIIHCNCYDGCEEMGTCCYDYRDLCVFGSSSTLTDTSDDLFPSSESEDPFVSIYSSTQLPETSRQTSTMLISRSDIMATTQPTTFEPTSRRPATTPTSKITPTTLPTTKIPFRRNLTSVSLPTSSKQSTSTIKSTVSTLITSRLPYEYRNTTTTTSKPTILPTKQLFIRTSTKPTISTLPTNRKWFNGSTTVTSIKGLSDQSTTANKNNKIPTEPPVEKAHVSTYSPILSTATKNNEQMILKQMELERHWKNVIKSTDNDFLSSYLLIISGGITLIVIGGLASVILYRKFRSDPANYKTATRCRNANDEFSEIRYLTGEEELDFTLATIPCSHI